jgi:hypothetical protein
MLDCFQILMAVCQILMVLANLIRCQVVLQKLIANRKFLEKKVMGI